MLAALDLGTNNCRLLVARPVAHDGFRVIDAFSRIVRLGEGLGASGELSAAAMARTIEALKVCAGKMRRRGVTHVRAVATEACRRAANCAEFLDAAERATGIRLEIIDHVEEARLALMGCAPLLDSGKPEALIFDIGGGSTEMSWLDVAQLPRGRGSAARADRALRALHSVPIGVVTLAERHGGHEVTPRSYAAMVEEVQAAIAPFEAEHDLGGAAAAGRLQMLGTSGTVTTLAGVHQRLPRYDRARVDGCHLDFATVEAVTREIAEMDYGARAAHPCIGPERADLVIAGCAILEALCRTWPVGRLRVADRGLREGILFTLMRQAAAAPSHAGADGRDSAVPAE